VQGRASCPSSKDGPTDLEKNTDLKHHGFEKSVEHYLWKGMKPFPALAQTLHGKSCNSFV
jgi:hypothetical protein